MSWFAFIPSSQDDRDRSCRSFSSRGFSSAHSLGSHVFHCLITKTQTNFISDLLHKHWTISYLLVTKFCVLQNERPRFSVGQGIPLPVERSIIFVLRKKKKRTPFARSSFGAARAPTHWLSTSCSNERISSDPVTPVRVTERPLVHFHVSCLVPRGACVQARV